MQAFIQRHNDIRTQVPLDSYYILGGQKMFPAVDMRLNSAPLSLTRLNKARLNIWYPAAIGKYRAFPGHKTMQPPAFFITSTPGLKNNGRRWIRLFALRNLVIPAGISILPCPAYLRA